MLKKVNIILLFFVLPLSLNLKLGYVMILPLLLFYLLKDFKNIYYTYIPSLISTVLFVREYFIITLSIYIVTLLFYYLITMVVNKKNPNLTTFVIAMYLLISNIVSLVLLKQNNVYTVILTSALIILLYLYLERFLYKILLEQTSTTDNMLSSLAYLEIMLAIVGVFSASTFTFYKINFGFVLGIYYAMLFGRSYKNIYSILFGVTSMLLLYLGYGIQEALFIPFISALYMISNLFLVFILNVVICALLFTNTGYETNMLISVMVESIIFEIASSFLIDELKTDEDLFSYIYSQVQKGTNNEILNFALFLDKFTNSFKNPKEFNERISEGIKVLIHNQCSYCQKRKECFAKYKIELYSIFKNMLLQEPNNEQQYQEFYHYCSKASLLENTAKMLEIKVKSPMNDEQVQQNNIMLAQISGVSNAIKKYVVDLVAQDEISYYQMILLKKRLENYGYNVTYFEVIKLFKADFNVKLGIKAKNFNEIKSTIEILSKNIVGEPTTAILDHEDSGNIYINLVPKIQIDITYGFGSLSCDGEEICGDNYLIKEINNGRFISAISDGMGKGYKAFYESDTTLKLVEDIIKLNLSSGTALEILNSFYSIQEYLEEYATLDFLEINRYTKIANFYKMGASTTYIFRVDGTIEKVINKSLPFGIEEEISNATYKLSQGDLVLMSSDGIFENIIDEGKLQSYIETIKNLPPQRIVYELLNYTLNNKIKTKDDMSIIALKIEDAA